MKRLLMLILAGSILITATAQQNMLDFGKAELKKAFTEIKSANNSAFLFFIDKNLQAQAYNINQNSQKEFIISAGDTTGLMYACLEMAEQIRINNKVPSTFPIKGEPYIKKRGLKFNIPLDIRNPSYQDAGDAAQQNIAEMWNFDFWKQYLDMMARNRYNVLTLWNPHPFPSMIKMKNYPDVALKDVCGTSFPLDKDRTDEPTAKFIAGCGISQQVLDNLIVLKKMSIEEKIVFWRKVMGYAKNRGVKVYFITWNIWMNSLAPSGWYRDQKNKKGNEGKYGINNDQENVKTIAYLREAVKEFILTYPDLAGIGITAGENMEDRTDEYDREKWLWATYGEGITDAKKIQPGRKIEFIHRHWQSGVDKMVNDFISKYPDEINLSFKYARARMYATPAPRWADEYVKELKQYNLKSWWNVRNDDVFHFRWGDPAFASAFIKNFPEQITEGYFMGSDSYVWGREFISKHPTSPRQLEVEKHWYNFMLWGRMGYNPDISQTTIEGMLAQRYKGVNSQQLFKAWATASKITSLATKFHWHDWDFMWAVEGCLDLRKGFHTVEDFINKKPMQGSGIISIPDAVKALLERKDINGITPLQVAASLDSLGDATLVFTKQQHVSEGKYTEEYRELLYDMDAFSYLGKYYADKIRAAYYLQAHRVIKDDLYKQKTIASLKNALIEWRSYAAAASRNYNPQFLSKTRTIDWNELTNEVEKEWSTFIKQ
ncbi:hypothetical protein [Lacibacter sp.]|uniref:hypothetical protein n=1 Tax=Lacibacter sp. TaxID=1915409 RepID=UPI002B4AC432|nr:hypothetical protein [Lacibacter sp.]HLP37648.1 hypothetical protein [Lacibacter sp.]